MPPGPVRNTISLKFLERDLSRSVSGGKDLGVEANMSSLNKYGFAIAVILLAGSMTLQFSPAQSRTYSNVIQMGDSGSYLGIQMEDVNADSMAKHKLSSERGVIVRSVAKGSPAEAANLKEEDVILEFGGTPVWSTMQFSRLVKETPAGRKVDIIVSRDGKRVNLSAKIETHEERRADNRIDILPRDFFVPNMRGFEFRSPDNPGANSSESAPGKPRLGVSIQPLTEQLGEFLGVPKKKGVLIASVIEGSPSAGKLKSGDVIISADGKDVADPEDLTNMIQDKSEGSMTLKVIRDKKEITVVVNLPAEEGKGYKL
jgi:serine protease Do